MSQELDKFFREIRGLPYNTFENLSSRHSDPTFEIDDAVTLGIKVLCARWSLTIFLWMISYLLVMLQVISNGTLVSSTALLFLPMWTGSVLAIMAVVLVISGTCSNTRLISPEQRLFLRTRGNVDESQYIDYDSLPLLRRLFFVGAVSALFALMAITTQILFYLWLMEGVIGMWNALCPVIIVFIIILCYMFAMNTISLSSCLVASLLVIDMMLFAMKISGEVSSLSWVLVSAPIIIVQGYWIVHLLKVVRNDTTEIYRLTLKQKLCSVMYLISMLLSLLAEFTTCITNGSLSQFPQWLWVIAVPLFVIAAAIVLREEAALIAFTRGYTDPQPLSRTEDGWEPLLGSSITSLLLGTISVPYTVDLSAVVPGHDERVERGIVVMTDLSKMES